MTHVRTEIASQPDCWAKAAELAQSPSLPSSGERVAVAGCGTSWFMAMAVAALRERAGQGETDAFQASEFPLGRAYDRVVAITRSGTTLPVRPDVEQITFLGRGWTIGLAEEAALKRREAAAFWVEAYPAVDYRHGPISIAAPGRVVWAFGEIPAHLIEDVEATGAAVVHARHHSGHAALGRWSGGRSPLDPMADLIVAQRVAVALAANAATQAWTVSRRSQGLDPDRPRNLTRSVVLA